LSFTASITGVTPENPPRILGGYPRALDQDEQKAKLELVAHTAAKVWG
jgi:hypothetical protein